MKIDTEICNELIYGCEQIEHPHIKRPGTVKVMKWDKKEIEKWKTQKKLFRYFAQIKRNEALQKKIKTAMYSKNIPFNTPFKIIYKNHEEICKIGRDINGNYELQIYCGGIWLPANKSKLSVSRLLFGEIKIIN